MSGCHITGLGSTHATTFVIKVNPALVIKAAEAAEAAAAATEAAAAAAAEAAARFHSRAYA